MEGQEMSENTAQTVSYAPEHERSLLKALACAKGAIDKKCERMKILDLTEMGAFSDFFVICSGTNEKHVQAIANHIEYSMKQQGIRAVDVEGSEEGRWILMDYGDVVIHVFLDAIRDYYDIDQLWDNARRVLVPPEFYGPAASEVN